MKIVIIGSGIAGLALGAILQNNGFEICINERNENLDSKGHAFLMHPDGLNVLNIIAKYNPDFKIPGQIINKIVQKNSDYTDIQTTELDSWICMKRVALIEYLLLFIKPQNINYGRFFSHFLYENDKVIAAVFTNGSIEYGDIFIGADGAHSKVRKEIFGDIKFTSVQVKEIIGVLKDDKLAAHFQNRFTKFLCENKGIALGIIPCSSTELVWFMQYDTTLETEAIDTPEKIQIHCYKLLELFSDEVRQFLVNNDFSSNYIWHSTDFDLLPSFHKNNVLLIGDAAHLASPFTSAGVVNALVDANLMAELIISNNKITEIGSTFYTKRAPQIKAHIQLGRDIKDQFLKGTKAGVVLPLIAEIKEKEK